NPFLATVGLRIEPGPVGSGIEFRLEVELGSMPYAFFRAVEDTLRTTLRQGLQGWEVADCVVTMTHSGYLPRQSHAPRGFAKSWPRPGPAFRGRPRLVVRDAVKEGEAIVYEPIHRFQLEAPADVLGPLLPALARLHAVPQQPAVRGLLCILE